MYKIELDIEPLEMMALGYAISAGIQVAQQRDEKQVLEALHSLFTKIHIANSKAAESFHLFPKDPTRIVNL